MYPLVKWGVVSSQKSHSKGLNELIHIKHLEQCLAHRKHSKTSYYYPFPALPQQAPCTFISIHSFHRLVLYAT